MGILIVEGIMSINDDKFYLSVKQAYQKSKVIDRRYDELEILFAKELPNHHIFISKDGDKVLVHYFLRKTMQGKARYKLLKESTYDEDFYGSAEEGKSAKKRDLELRRIDADHQLSLTIMEIQESNVALKNGYGPVMNITPNKEIKAVEILGKKPVEVQTIEVNKAIWYVWGFYNLDLAHIDTLTDIKRQ
jgi:hypothetical protein